MPIGLYLHVPFCLKKCHYCDFVSYPKKEVEVEGYLENLKREMALYSEKLSIEEKKLVSLYLGGGTPTCLASGQLLSLLEKLDKLFVLPKGLEVTIEANPGTVSKEKLTSLFKAGVNRISLGVQSLNDEKLKELGRVHLAKEAKEAFYLAREVGFENISVDLMMALPKQNKEEWLNTLRETVALNPEHISAYSLKIESGTIFDKLNAEGKLNLPTEEEELVMYEEAISFLRVAGYEHYEISNFALENRKSKHNLIYWRNEEYLGLGPGAHSFLNKTRWANFSDLKLYDKALKDDELPIEIKENLSLQEEMTETVIMGLRLLEGLSLERFRSRFNISLEDAYKGQVEKLLKQGLVEIKAGKIRLTKRGLPIANMVFEGFV